MKRFLITFSAVLAALVAAVALASNTITYDTSTGQTFAAEIFKLGGSTDTGALRVGAKSVVLYDSGTVASGAAIDSGTLDSSGCSAISMFVTNSDATNARTPSFTLMTGSGGTIEALSVASIAANTRAVYEMGHAVSTGGAFTTTIAYPFTPPPKLRLQLGAGGSSNGRIVAWCR